MSDVSKKNTKMQMLEFVTKILYLCLAVSTFHPFIYATPVQPLFVKLTLASGMLLLLLRIKKYRSYLKIPGIVLMLLFCFSFAFTTIMNRQYGISENGKWVIWTGIQFFVLYACDVKRPAEDYRKEFRFISHLIISYSVAAAAVSILMLLTSYSAVIYTADGEMLIAGLKWGRLWGSYTDPNYGSVFCAVAMILSWLFFIQKKGKIRVLYVCSLVLNLLYIIFSDSRTGELALILGLGLFVYLWLVRKWNKKKVYRYLASVCILLCIGIGLFGGIQLIKTGYNEVMQPILREGFCEEIGRPQDLENDVSNGRLDLWKSGIEVWEKSPFYGVGYDTFVTFAEKYLPDTYAVNNEQGEYTSLHNSFLNIFVFQGMFGMALFLILVGRLLVYVIPCIRRAEGEEYLELSAMFASICVIGVAMMFLLEGLYTNSPGSFVLWTFAGYMIHRSYRMRSEGCL